MVSPSINEFISLIRLKHRAFRYSYAGIIFAILLSVSWDLTYSQNNTVANFRKTITSDHKLFINYDIPDDNSAIFTVKLKFTYNGELIDPDPDNVYGDYGENITPGEKILYWDFENEPIQDINKVQVEISLIPEKSVEAIVELGTLSNSGFAPSEISFNNLSTNADSYRWDFGDPESGSQNISKEFNAYHLYNNPGIYTVTLTAINSQTGQQSKFYQTVEINAHDTPVADFQINPDNPKAPVKITFINLSMNGNQYYWDFDDAASGDRNISLERNPQHKYKIGGTYTVKLLVSNSLTGKMDTVHKELTIQMADHPVPRFTFSQSSDVAPAIVSFENKSEFVDKYQWDFGDELSGDMNESTEDSPVHLYESPGNYIVTLKARPSKLKRSVVFTDTIQIEDPNKPVKAGFKVQNNNIYAPGTVVFTNTSTNATEFSWNFGDSDSGSSNSSGEVNPTHTYYQPGDYKVILVASGTGENEKSVFTLTVRILEVPQ